MNRGVRPRPLARSAAISTSKPMTRAGSSGSASTNGAPPSASPPHRSSGAWALTFTASSVANTTPIGTKRNRRASVMDLRERNLGPALSLFELVERPGPVFLQQTGERSIGKQTSSRLTRHAVVRFIRGIDDPLHWRAAHGARLAVAAVHGHSFAK